MTLWLYGKDGSAGKIEHVINGKYGAAAQSYNVPGGSNNAYVCTYSNGKYTT